MNKIEKEEVAMNACAVKPTLPFVTRSILKRTPASRENVKVAEYINEHNFSFDVDLETGELKSNITTKK